MKLFEFFQKRKKQKLLASASRGMSQASARASDEPNMKLSSAVLVVLILHLVAVGGIYAFSSIKAHRVAESPEPVEKKESSDNTSKKSANSNAQDSPSASKVQHNTSTAPDKTSDSSPRKNPTASSKNAPKDSGETYVVAKGDKLAAIARKLKVSGDDLLKLNKIDDPKTLQIGRKLRIPVKRPASDS